MVFSSSHEWMGEFNHKEGWVLKNWCFRTVELEKTLESPLDCKEIKPVNPKGKQPWIFIERTEAKAEVPIFWPPDAKSWLTGRLWCWERLKAKGEGGRRRWDGWMTSPTQGTQIFLIIYFFTLQYCIGFAIHWHESATGIHVFPRLVTFLTGVAHVVYANPSQLRLIYWLNYKNKSLLQTSNTESNMYFFFLME